MRVGYLVNTYPSPTHTFIKREIDALEAQGVDVVRYAIRAPEGPALEGEADKVRVVLGAGRNELLASIARTPKAALARAAALAMRLARGGARSSTHLAYLAEACLLREWTRDDRVEHLHVHFGTNGVVVAQLCAAMGGPPFSFTVHGPEEFDHPQQLKLREKIAAARFVVAISSFGRSQLLRWADAGQWDRVHVVHCAVDDGYLDREPTPVPDVIDLVSIGRLAPEKGQRVLVDAVARLHRDGVPVRVTIVGDGDLRPSLEAAIAANGLGDVVRLAGWVDNREVASMVEASRALVLPSFAEGLPVSIMEALALGRPVVTTSIAGIPELVRPGENGWLVPAGDVDALVDALRELLSTPVDALTAMGAAGAKAVRAEHRASTEAAKLVQLFGAK